MAALDYRYAIELLQQKLIVFIRLNEKMNPYVGSKVRFIDVTESTVLFNFMEFTDGYRARFIEPDFEDYCFRFLELIKPVFQDFTREIKYGGQGYRVKIRLKDQEFEKLFTILNNKEDE